MFLTPLTCVKLLYEKHVLKKVDGKSFKVAPQFEKDFYNHNPDASSSSFYHGLISLNADLYKKVVFSTSYIHLSVTKPREARHRALNLTNFDLSSGLAPLLLYDNSLVCVKRFYLSCYNK